MNPHFTDTAMSSFNAKFSGLVQWLNRTDQGVTEYLIDSFQEAVPLEDQCINPEVTSYLLFSSIFGDICFVCRGTAVIDISSGKPKALTSAHRKRMLKRKKQHESVIARNGKNTN